MNTEGKAVSGGQIYAHLAKRQPGTQHGDQGRANHV